MSIDEPEVEPIAGIERLEQETEDDDGYLAERFAGRDVIDYEPGVGLAEAEHGAAYRVRVESESEMSFAELFASLVADPQAKGLEALVLGCAEPEDMPFCDLGQVQREVIQAADLLPQLRALFLNDVTSDECPGSRLLLPNFAPLVQRFQHLEHLRVRGSVPGGDDPLGPLESETLRSLTWQSAAIYEGSFSALAKSHLPALEHLELWVGSSHYGGIGTVELLLPLLTGKLFPSLRYLGLRNALIADEITAALASAPVLDQIEVLDLSKGTLSDRGAASLLSSPRIKKLRRLDLHHHFISPGVQEQLGQLGPEVDLSEPQEPPEEDDEGEWFEDERYVSLGE